jgi:hypothetical protein
MSVRPSPSKSPVTSLALVALNPDSLAEFSFDTGAAPHWDWPGDKIWYEQVLNFIRDGKTRIHFNLDGIDNPAKFADDGIGADPVFDYGRLTAWELNQIRQNPDCWSRVIFYKNGKVRSNPFV